MNHLKKFENFENIADPSHGQNMSDAPEKDFENDRRDYDQPYVVEDVLIDLSSEKATMKTDQGELAISVLYDTEDPSEDKIAIECTCDNPSGFLEMPVADLQKLFKVAQRELDNFPKIF